jgi:hypothetical protein
VDAVAPHWRARLPPGSYADIAVELDTDDDYEEEEEVEEDEEEEEEEEAEPRDQRAHAPAARRKDGSEAVRPQSLTPGAHSEPGSPRARLRTPGRLADNAVQDNDARKQQQQEEEAGYVPELVMRGGGDRAGTSQFTGVYWNTHINKWQAQCKGKYLGRHTTEEGAARAYSKYLKDGVDPRPASSSRFKGVSWHKQSNKWAADCKGTRLGSHTMEEDAERAYSKYLKDGIDPVKHREANTSQFTGVSWNKQNGKWTAKYQRKYLGRHATEEAAAQAYNVEAARLGVALNVIPHAGATGAGTGPGAGGSAAPKRAAPMTPAAPATNKNTKRAAPKTLAATAPSKKLKL